MEIFWWDWLLLAVLGILVVGSYLLSKRFVKHNPEEEEQ